MFSGIVEELGEVIGLKKDGSNLNITVKCSFADELTIDQSIAHNGVCLTVVRKDKNSYSVIAIKETLLKSNLEDIKIGAKLNLERSMLMNGRIDGHIVQGHIDQTAVCIGIQEANGSWYYTFEYDPNLENITVEKGSICVNGVSLTVVNSQDDRFSVAVIPYTYKYTNFYTFKIETRVNIEFDILGKYVTKILSQTK